MSPSYELLVEGWLTASLIRRLDACGHTVRQGTVLRLRASPSELEEFLGRCEQAGVHVQRVRYAY
jgi:hypothetical protein